VDPRALQFQVAQADELGQAVDVSKLPTTLVGLAQKSRIYWALNPANGNKILAGVDYRLLLDPLGAEEEHWPNRTQQNRKR
jgi:hypothetical protein